MATMDNVKYCPFCGRKAMKSERKGYKWCGNCDTFFKVFIPVGRD